MNRRFHPGWTASIFLWLLLATTANAAPKVVVSLKPIHSLVAGLMQGVETPQLLLDDTQSPHQMSLRPSQIRMLHSADLIVWVGARLEPALAHTIDQKVSDAQIIELIKSPGLQLLPIRNRRAWHSHGDHDDKQKSDEGVMVDHHIWLSPENAVQIVRDISEVLQRLDPQHRQTYQDNSRKVLQRLQDLERKIGSDLAPVKHLPYIVFHDAYQYFEAYFGLDAVGSVSIDPEQLSGARHLHTLRDTISRTGARCLFTEPQFEPKLVQALIENTAVRAGQLDPLGQQLPAGPDSYFQLMQSLSDNLRNCILKEPKE